MLKEPSNRTIALFLITFFVVVLVIGISIYKEKTSQVVVQEDNISLTVGKIANGEDDADGDGLRDWEESLWGTDSNNPDTDGDGTSDSAEITEQRDPTVPAPGDEMTEVDAQKSLLISQQSVYSNYREGSLTDNLAQNLLNSYAGLKQDNSLGTANEDIALDNIVASADSQVAFIGPYTSIELTTFSTETPQLLKKYGNDFGQAQLDFLIDLEEVDASKEGATSAVYKNHASKIMSIATPASQKERQVSIANQYYVLSQVVENIDNYKDDPVKALLSVQQYQKSQEDLTVFYRSIQTFLRGNAIIFNDNEPGSLLW